MENIISHFFKVEQKVSKNDEQQIYAHEVKEKCIVAFTSFC